MPQPYILPQVQVFQEFTEISPEITNPLRAWIVGPNANLFRYSDEDEKRLIGLGQYNPLLGTTVSWPGKTVASVVDQDYAKLFIDGAKLQYFADLIGSDSTVVSVANYKNRIRSSTVNFVETDGYSRNAALLDRDVKKGDLVWIRGSSGGSQASLWSYVRDLVPDVVPAVISAPTADAANTADQGAAVTITHVAGAVNEVELSVDVTDYNALPDGHIDDTYTIKCVGASVGGDYRTGKLLITTASGVEYLSDVTPGADSVFKAVGNRGLKIAFDNSASSLGISPGIDIDDLVVGQTWTVRIQQAFTHPTMGKSGTYIGKIANTYVITVTNGGLFGDADVRKRPRVSINTVYGTDGSRNIIVDQNVAFSLGTSGAAMQFNTGAGLNKGDRFYVAVTPRDDGPTRTIVLGHNLPAVLLAATDLDLKLYIQADIEVPRYVTDPVPGFNWEPSDTEVTIHDTIYAFDPTWTSNGEQQPLPVTAGTVYLQYREWLPTLIDEVNGMQDISQIDDIPGPLDPDNPLKWAVSKAVANCGGTGVRYTAVADPSELPSWVHALALGTERTDLYSLVPLSTDQDVLDLFVAHVNTMSSETKGAWRKVFINLTAQAISPVVDAAVSSDGEVVTAVIADDPNTSGSQYTLVTMSSTNAGFLALGVGPGDLLRTNYTTDILGEESYDEYVIAEVINEHTLMLDSGPTVPVSTPQKIEIFHTNSKTELAAQIGLLAGHYGNRRVCAVWPDTVGSAGRTFPGYHLCAALAGLAGGVVPQQHLTNIEVTGFDDFSRVTRLFSGDHLDDMAAYGVWIVTQNSDGNIITRDALTTDRTSLQSETEMVVRNVDSISYLMRSRLVKYIGRANVVQSTLDLIQIDLIGAIEFLKSNGFTARLGGQLIDADITTLRQHVIQKDRVVCAINLQIPYPLNVFELHLIA